MYPIQINDVQGVSSICMRIEFLIQVLRQRDAQVQAVLQGVPCMGVHVLR